MNESRRDRALRVIRKLLEQRVERGASPAEAAAAAAKAQELLRKYQLGIAELEGGRLDEDVRSERVAHGCRRVESWVFGLLVACTRPLDCAYVVSSSESLAGEIWHECVFVGHQSDVLVSRYLFVTLKGRLWAMAEQCALAHHRRGPAKRPFMGAFMTGAAKAIHDRLEAERQAAESACDRSRQLTVAKNSAVEAFMAREFPDVKLRRRNRLSDSALLAAAEGQKSGRAIALQRGVTGGASNESLPHPMLPR